MPNNNRCRYNKVYDPLTKRYRFCKKNKIFGDYCLCHNKILFEQHAIKIQSAYKGFFIRKKLKIYYNLPRDLQRKIIWHVNTDIYQRHFNSSIFKLIENRYIKFFKFLKDDNNFKIINNYFLNIDSQNSNLHTDIIIEFFSIQKISIKYYEIINLKKIEKFVKIIKRFNLIFINNTFNFESDDYKIISKYNSLMNC